MKNKMFMKMMKLILVILIALLPSMAKNTFAQDLTGRWEGTLLWAGNAGIKDDMTYDWEEGKWQNTTRTPTKLALELEKAGEDGNFTGSYFYGASGADQMKFDAIFADSMLKGASGARIKGGRQWGGYMELNFREQDGKRYLEGSWRTDANTKVWEGRVALRFEE